MQIDDVCGHRLSNCIRVGIVNVVSCMALHLVVVLNCSVSTVGTVFEVFQQCAL